MTGAVEPVRAIAPIVIICLTHRESFPAPSCCLRVLCPRGARLRADGDLCASETPEAERLLAIADPYAYRDRLTMPKFILNSAGDQFFPAGLVAILL